MATKLTLQEVFMNTVLQERDRCRVPKLARSLPEIIQLRLLVKQCAFEIANQRLKRYRQIMSTHDKIDVSKTSVKSLKRTALQHLRLEEVHKGRYLILRTLEVPYKVAAITTAVEDHEGNAVLFTVYNFTADPNPNLNDILPIGTVFLLKEPYLKTAANGDTVVRCDCPSDIIVLYKGHELFSLAEGIVWKNYIDPINFVDVVRCHPEPKTASEWKKRGNKLYKENKFEYAIRCYLLGLKNLSETGDDGPMVQILSSNLSAAYLWSGFFEKALEFAENVLMVEPANRKALLRAGKSNYRLKKYEDAKGYFEKCLGLFPDDEETKTELQKAKERCFEQETGEFDIKGMAVSVVTQPRKKIECADYVGPIKIIAIEGKGRGVVATRDLEPITLLAVSKAIVYAWAPENTFQMDINYDRTFDIGNRRDVVAELASLITKNPCVFGPIVYDLFDGKQQVNKDSVPLFCDPDTKQEPIVDVQRLKDILTTNAFGAPPETFSEPPMLTELINLNESGSGLYALPSYFNHSCAPNATYFMFNDVVIIKNIKFIKAGEEICVPYFPPELPYSERQQLCQQRGFQCLCESCNLKEKEARRLRSKMKSMSVKSKD